MIILVSDQEPEATCDGNSICSFLQANTQVLFLLQIYSWTFFKGVNVVEYCKCEGFSKCSTSWDPYDGKSITQAQSDQYKVGTRIEAFIDTQTAAKCGNLLPKEESHQCQFTKWFWAVKTCFTTMGGKFIGI